MNISEAIELAKTKAEGFNEKPIESEKSFIFLFDTEDNEKAIDAPIICVNKESKKVVIKNFVTLTDSEKKALFGIEEVNE